MPNPFRTSFIVIERPSALGLDGLADRLRLLAELGYDGAEFQLTPEPPAFFDGLQRLLDDHRLTLPSFLTGEAYGEGLRLCSPDAAVRQATVERLIGYLPVARRFGAIMIVGLLQGLRHDEPDERLAVPRIEEGLKRVAEAAERIGVEVVVEPVNHLQVGFHNSVAEVQGLIARVGSPAVRPMVDTIHMNIEEASLTAPIRGCGPALRHVHLCESNGGRFGTGHVDFAAVLTTLGEVGYRHWCSVKVYRNAAFEEAARSSIAVLREAASRPSPGNSAGP